MAGAFERAEVMSLKAKLASHSFFKMIRSGQFYFFHAFTILPVIFGEGCEDARMDADTMIIFIYPDFLRFQTRSLYLFTQLLFSKHSLIE